MNSFEIKGFTRFETAMGLAVLAIVVLVCLPWFRSGLLEEPALRAAMQAEELAMTIRDYRQETGRWPASDQGQFDLTCLTAPRPEPLPVATAASGGGLGLPLDSGPVPWLREIPVDPWGRPFRSLVLAGGPNRRATDATAIVVMSAGPDGDWNTDPAGLWNRTGLANPFDGDDQGFVLVQTPQGDAR